MGAGVGMGAGACMGAADADVVLEAFASCNAMRGRNSM